MMGRQRQQAAADGGRSGDGGWSGDGAAAQMSMCSTDHNASLEHGCKAGCGEVCTAASHPRPSSPCLTCGAAFVVYQRGNRAMPVPNTIRPAASGRLERFAAWGLIATC